MPVTIEINGTRFGGWERVRIDRSIETLSGAFSLGVSERWPGNESISRGIKPGDRCVVRIDKDVVVSGYVDDVDPSLDAESHDIDISGRDNTSDLIDCSAIHKPGQWSKLRLEQIAQELIDPFKGITIKTQVDTGERFTKFALEPGETVHEAIMRMCKLRAVLAISDGLGNLIFTTAGKSKTNTALIEGKNIKSIQGHFSHLERFSEVHVKAQSQGSDHQKAAVTTGWKGTAKEPEIKRYRPLLVMAEGQANTKQCQERAAWEVATRSGKGTRINIQVAGWRQNKTEGSPLWSINSLAWVQSDTLKIKQSLLIASVSFSLDESGGEITDIELVKPDAYKLIREIEDKS